MERPSHPTPKGVARGEQRLRRIQSMVDEGVVQKLGRARVHTTKRVEGKRNEAKLVLVADLLIRLDVVVVEQVKARHRASLPTRLVIDTNRIGRITNGHIQNIRDPSLVSDNEVRPFAGRNTILISLERELIRRLDVLPTISVHLKLELPGSISKGVTDPVVTPGPLRPRERAHNSMSTINACGRATARMMQSI